MLSIEVNSLPIAEIFGDISKAFGTDFTESCGEYYIDIPKHLGKGNIRGIDFDGGMGIVQYDCLFKTNVEFQFTVNEVHPLKFLYCLEGLLEHRFEDEDEIHKITQYQEAIVASNFFNGHILHFSASEHTVVNSLEITRSVFQEKIKCDLVTMNDNLQNLFNDVHAEKTFYHDGFYSLELADLFREMQSFEGEDFLRKLFLEGKAYQMLTKQILLFEDDLADVDKRTILRRSEVTQIGKAVQLINEEIESLDNIDQIAYKVGINANKLQEGFQNLYGLTVNQFIQRVRLNLIKDMVLNTDYSISEIVHMVGLSSKSYLSKIFREEYGTSPSEYRRHFLDSLNKKRKLDK
ncbi:helix-turn-helix domain-containing protein [Pareuzebyella sediminis]|uniref:helix-turn-helix domain-containing protein n=1 Tax=Pareuzebyella sediminis TaxID=2607998 RepID=UPI0011EF8E67|nr:AraC family transcriptional regulator [Pareuzebyella sediminis]